MPLQRSLPLLPLVLTTALFAQVPPAPPLLDDSLLGATTGELYGGELTPDGFRPTVPDGHLLHRLHGWPAAGTLEVEVRGMRADTDGDHAFFALYDGRGIAEPARYFEDFRENHFRLNLHWRVERRAIKAVVTCAAPARLADVRAVFPRDTPRDFTAEPTGATVAWDPERWHRLRLEWSPTHVSVAIDDLEVWRAATALPYAPREPRLWLGCAPGHGAKYRNHLPALLYRHLRLTPKISS